MPEKLPRGRNTSTGGASTPNIGSLFHSKSETSLNVRDGDHNKSSIKIPLPPRKTSLDKTPVTHFCTPIRRGSMQPTSSAWERTPQGSSHLLRHMSETSLVGHSTPNFLSGNSSCVTPECFSRVKMDTPTPRRHAGDATLAMEVEEASNLTVGVRVRPMSEKEIAEGMTSVVTAEKSNVHVMCDTGTGTTHTFVYDHCFPSDESGSQESIFSTMVQPLVDKAFQGYNACLFAYGQTGSGKSYSMMGPDAEVCNGPVCTDAGIIPRFCHELFERIASLDDSKVSQQVPSGVTPLEGGPRATLEISYFEIYNEKIHDLLGGPVPGGGDPGRRAPLKVREHPQYGPYVVDLSVHCVESYQDLQGWLSVGNSQRATASTGMNEKSSRSHSIFSVILAQTNNEDNAGLSRRSKINLVDLAGSERLSQTCASGDRLREGVSINRSLLTLGKVIAALADSSASRRRNFVPYRESVLTWLLRESLGGNSRTTMLATISPCNTHMDETLATLRYACQARTIVNKVRVNEDPNHRRIRQLLAEIAALRAKQEELERQQVQKTVRTVPSPCDPSVEQLRRQLRESEEQLASMQKSWAERLKEADSHKNAAVALLRRRGVALAIDWAPGSPQRQNATPQHPFLINLAPDPTLSGALLYLLPPGAVRIGRLRRRIQVSSPEGRQSPDIQLDGPLVQPMHCTIENTNGQLVLQPGLKGQCFVNGVAVTSRTPLHHGDRLVIGGNHYFRVCNSADRAQGSSLSEPADFEFARNEIIAVQESKLQMELEEARNRAFEELEEVKLSAEQRLNEQRTEFQAKLEQLGSTLEEQRTALENERLQKNKLLAQCTAFEAEVERQRKTQDLNGSFAVHVSPPNRTTFLKNLEELLNSSSSAYRNNGTETDSVLSLNQSKSTLNGSDWTPPTPSLRKTFGLHEMQLMVQEATERCKDLALPYIFQQQQVIFESRLQRAIRVRDFSQHLVALWSVEKFTRWLERVREFGCDDSLTDIVPEDIEEGWEPDEDWGEMDTSNISVNTLPMRRKLDQSLFMSVNNLNSTIQDSDEIDECLTTLKNTSSRLHALFGMPCNSAPNGPAAQKALFQIDDLVVQLKSLLSSAASTPATAPPQTPVSTKSVRFLLNNSVNSSVNSM